MKVVQLLSEATHPEGWDAVPYEWPEAKGWEKKYDARIVLKGLNALNTKGLDLKAVLITWNKAKERFKEMRDSHPTKLQFGDAHTTQTRQEELLFDHGHTEVVDKIEAQLKKAKIKIVKRGIKDDGFGRKREVIEIITNNQAEENKVHQITDVDEFYGFSTGKRGKRVLASDNAVAIMKSLEYPGWPMCVEIPHGSYTKIIATRKEPIKLETTDFEASVTHEHVSIEQVDGGLKVSVPETRGPQVSLMSVIAYYLGKAKMKLTSVATGKPIDASSYWGAWRGQRFIVKGDEEKIRKIIKKYIDSSIEEEKRRHKEKTGALDRRREDAKYSYQMAKTEREHLEKKYGKDIIDRVKIKSLVYDGDDGYQWSLWVDGERYKSGLTRRQAEYERNAMWDWLKLQRDDPKEAKDRAAMGRALRHVLGGKALSPEEHVAQETSKYLNSLKRVSKQVQDSETAAKAAIDHIKSGEAAAKNVIRKASGK